mgnify:CR=1 FL=1
MQNRSLSGKTALVTGSTSGIGLGIAHALAAQGANIVMNGFGDAAAIDQLQKDIAQQHGVRTIYSGADMSKGEQIAAMVKEAERDARKAARSKGPRAAKPKATPTED